MNSIRRSFLLILFACAHIMLGCNSRIPANDLYGNALRLADSSKYKEAIMLLDELVARNELLPEVLFLRSDCYYKIGATDSMILDLKSLVLLGQASCQQRIIAANDIAIEYDFRSLVDSAILYQWKAIRLAQSCAVDTIPVKAMFFILSTLYGQQRRFEMAHSMLDSSLASGLDKVVVAELRASLFINSTETDSAIFWTSFAIKHQTMNPSNLKWRFQDRANLYHQKGELKAACADWQKALDLGLEDAQPKLDSFCRGR